MNNLNVVIKNEYTTKNSIFAKNLTIPLIIFFHLEDTNEDIEVPLIFSAPSYKSKNLDITRYSHSDFIMWDINYEITDPKNITILNANDNFVIVRENIKIPNLYFKTTKDPLEMVSSKAQSIVEISTRAMYSHYKLSSTEFILKLSEIPDKILKILFTKSTKYSVIYHLYKKELEFRKKNNLHIKEFKKII